MAITKLHTFETMAQIEAHAAKGPRGTVSIDRYDTLPALVFEGEAFPCESILFDGGRERDISTYERIHGGEDHPFRRIRVTRIGVVIDEGHTRHSFTVGLLSD